MRQTDSGLTLLIAFFAFVIFIVVTVFATVIYLGHRDDAPSLRGTSTVQQDKPEA